MKRLSLAGFVLAAAFLAYVPAHAGSVNGIQQAYVCDATTDQGTNCIKPALTAVPGTQRGLAISSATALTIPAGATIALIQAQGTNNTGGACLFWEDDGTNPTSSAGQEMAATQSMYYQVRTLPIKLIAASGATCTATISYYQ